MSKSLCEVVMEIDITDPNTAVIAGVWVHRRQDARVLQSKTRSTVSLYRGTEEDCKVFIVDKANREPWFGNLLERSPVTLQKLGINVDRIFEVSNGS